MKQKKGGMHMKIFVTGATGFIGTHLIKRLAQTEHEAICLVRPTSNVEKLEKLGVTLVLGDVTDSQSVLEGMKGCDWVMNLANIHSFWERDRSLYWKVNVVGTRNVMESALKTGVKKVIHVSSVVIWGKPLTWPITEDKDVGPERFSEYAMTKYEGDLIAWDLFKNKGLPLVVIYPAGVLGPGDTKYFGQYIQNLINERIPSMAFKESISTFVHVKDVAEAIIRAAEKKDNIGEKYIVGTHQLSIKECSELISEMSGAKLPRYTIPDWLARTNAFLLTMLSKVTGRPPLWGLSMDAVKFLEQDLAADGSKAERELGITYTPVRKAIEDEIHPPGEAEHPYKHRKYSRFKVSRPLTLQPENMEQRIVQLRDISRGGLFVETDKPLRKGMEIAANFSEKPEEGTIIVKGKVLRKTSKGMAVQFIGGGAHNISTLLMH
jgi:dihydroflavonol-4-reductase